MNKLLFAVSALALTLSAGVASASDDHQECVAFPDGHHKLLSHEEAEHAVHDEHGTIVDHAECEHGDDHGH